MVPLMGISLSSYRKWEQGTRDVSGPAATFSRDRKGTGSGETRLAGFGPELTPPRLLAKPTFSRRIGPAKPRENGTSADPSADPERGRRYIRPGKLECDPVIVLISVVLNSHHFDHHASVNRVYKRIVRPSC